MLLTVYNSKTDSNGNRYWAVELTHFGNILAVGTISARNIYHAACHELGWEVVYIELPVREFNNLTKGWGYLGCKWEEIKNNLIKHLNENNNSRK